MSEHVLSIWVLMIPFVFLSAFLVSAIGSGTIDITYERPYYDELQELQQEYDALEASREPVCRPVQCEGSGVVIGVLGTIVGTLGFIAFFFGDTLIAAGKRLKEKVSNK